MALELCTRCVLPSNFPSIIFNNEGVCNYCEFYDANQSILTDFTSLEKEFIIRIEKAKDRAKGLYDCLVGFSGGKDSTYIIYELKSKYKMRVLAFTYDNGLCSEYSHRSIINLLKKLDVDHVRFTPNESFFRKAYSLSASEGKQINFCTPCCRYAHYYSHLTASEKGIPLVVNGRSRGQILQAVLSKKMLEPFETTYGFREGEYVARKILDYSLLDRLEKDNISEPLLSSKTENLSYFMYHPYDQERNMDFIEENLGWERYPKGMDHLDCWAHPLAMHLRFTQTGSSYLCGELSVDIREGKISREEALLILEKDIKESKNIKMEVIEQFKGRFISAKKLMND